SFFRDNDDYKGENMKLSDLDADLFWELMWGLQFFVNRKLKIVKNVPGIADYISDVSQEDKMKVRESLFKDSKLIKQYVKRNPDRLSEDKLEILSKWEKPFIGDFFIERFLKKHAIFISDPDVYAVVGIKDGLDEMFHKSQLPHYTKAVLLPFKGKITYDGLLFGSRMFFGSGIKRRLKEVYMAAKQNDRIIETLELEAKPKPEKTKKIQASKQWKPEIEKLAAKAKKLKGGKDQPAINTPAFSLVKASLELARAAVSDPDDVDTLYDCLNKVDRAGRKVGTILSRTDY
ncbi:hypothetical protein QUF70_17925, partial [Desulfobacterales bacterium HSG17]|nr:hypothetical protein [Desulfobacterales bacterium HSG17]